MDRAVVKPANGNSRGFTAGEVVLTVAIAGVLLAMTVPTVATTLGNYRRNGAARHVLAQIREVQSLAVARRDVFGFHWGGDPDVKLGQHRYRVVRDTTGSCGFPATSVAEDDQDVIQGWTDLTSTFSGMQIESIVDNNNSAVGGVMFNSLGASVNTCGVVSFPLRIVIGDGSGTTKTIEIRSAGSTKLL